MLIHKATTKKINKKTIRKLKRYCRNTHLMEKNAVMEELRNEKNTGGKMGDIYTPLSFITLNVSRLNSQTPEIGIWLYKKKKGL